MGVRKLEPVRRHAENDLTLLEETPYGYIFTLSFNDYILGYEVFEKRIEPAETKLIDGRKVVLPDREKYPSSSEFGEWAWYTRDKTRAQQILSRFEREAQHKPAPPVTPPVADVVHVDVVSIPVVPVAVEQPSAPLPKPVPPPVLQDMPADEPMVLGLFA